MPFRLGELAARVGGRVAGDSERVLHGLRALESAGPEDLSFFTDPKLRHQAEASGAGAILTGPATSGLGCDLLVCDDPGRALIDLLRVFHPEAAAPPGVHPTALVGAECRLAPSASIGPYVVIGEGCEIAEEVVLHPFVCVGAGSHIGRAAVLHPHVVLYPRTRLGERVVLHAGTVIGADGFGYVWRDGRHVKVPQVGSTVLEAEVEVGANSAIDRAALEETRVGAGTKIDNLVQVGHNVRIGRSSILCGQVGVAGSATLGDGVILAGQSGVSNRVAVGDGARVAGKSAVFDDVPAGAQVAGVPAVSAARWRRQVALLARLPEIRRRLAALERDSTRDRE
ncbi:MAG TPA: UDP-3-O-(3-hydroxymyristoyl)glucosamine N-acyltransferase [Thermoanaerobaculia bacterium]|nr:UDP-3-O-(3-hydroxymyristoyl)glucosamine N-acyltransferase [Thermoanaerobaculia bacterium]